MTRVGISGWTYAPWRGTFYPKKLPHKSKLAFASASLPSIEINGTFYGLQRPKSFAAWHDQTPDGFVFSVKAPRFITHIRRLRDVQTPVANFLLSGVLRLNEKLGPLPWQLLPNLQFDPELMAAFLAILPRSTGAAAGMAGHCDARMKGRMWVDIDRDRPLRHAVEVRHESFKTPDFVKLLRKHRVAAVVADTAGKWPQVNDVTADLVYLRLHGEEELYAGGYTDSGRRIWAGRIRKWSTGGDPFPRDRIGPAPAERARRDVYVYFDNDVKVRSPFDAARLAVKLKLRKSPLEQSAAIESTEVPRSTWPGGGFRSVRR